jgi:hypothetical protein
LAARPRARERALCRAIDSGYGHRSSARLTAIPLGARQGQRFERGHKLALLEGIATVAVIADGIRPYRSYGSYAIANRWEFFSEKNSRDGLRALLSYFWLRTGIGIGWIGLIGHALV